MMRVCGLRLQQRAQTAQGSPSGHRHVRPAAFWTLLFACLVAASTLGAPALGAAEEGACPSIPPDPVGDEHYPTYRLRCIPPERFVVDGRALGFQDAPPIDSIRPGINARGCTTSYLLTDGVGRYFLTFSAHCVFMNGDGGDLCVTRSRPLGSPVQIEGYDEPGVLRFASGIHMRAHGGTASECDFFDFAIFEVPSVYADRVHPAIRHVGGPVGLADPLALQLHDPIAGYGNSDDRGLVVELATDRDHGSAPAWPYANTFRGYYVGGVLDEAYCLPGMAELACDGPYESRRGYAHWLRYAPPKITGDSGSPDLTLDGRAIGVTSAISPIAASSSTVSLYDALLKIWHETGETYYLVTWDEWSPLSIET